MSQNRVEAPPALNRAADELIQALEATEPLLGLRVGLRQHLGVIRVLAAAGVATPEDVAAMERVWLALDALAGVVLERRQEVAR